ncbi:MAG: hypothetical protein IJW46_07390 [Clostridia bacterium]|nr:hypothetical protein [Clostridia bacterium]
MGRMLGAFDAGGMNDIPDLNKCPDCGCFFADDNCPICGKVCPEEMRAGNRKVQKKKLKKKDLQYPGRVTFVDWYHSWWAIILAMFVMPILGIILLATSPHQKWKKALFISIAVLYLVISSFGFSMLPRLFSMLDQPVDTSLTREDYIAAAEELSAEAFYRNPDHYEEGYWYMELQIVKRAAYSDSYYDDEIYYLCEAKGGSSYQIILRDCQVDDTQKLITGDVITVYGECGDETSVYVGEEWYDSVAFNMAYVVVEE